MTFFIILFLLSVDSNLSTTCRVWRKEQLQVTTEKLNDVVRKQKDEIDRLRRDNRELQGQLEERQSTANKFDRKLLEELSEQCDKLTQYLNTKTSTYASVR